MGGDAQDTLRAIVARIEQKFSQLPPTGDGKEAAAELRAAWNELVQTLALGAAPETRCCPACGWIGMRAATRCGHCWAALEQLPVELSRP